MKVSKFYKISENKVERTGKVCDRCGDGTFMAKHKDRVYCGKCGMTIWKKKEESPKNKKKEESPKNK